MKLTTVFNTLALPGLLAASLVLSPLNAMADNDGHHAYTRKHESHQRHADNRHYRSKHYYGKHHSGRHRTHRDHDSGKHYGHRYGRVYSYEYGRPHHRSYIVNEYYDNDDYIGLDRLRFMIGLHSNNLEIIFRD